MEAAGRGRQRRRGAARLRPPARAAARRARRDARAASLTALNERLLMQGERSVPLAVDRGGARGPAAVARRARRGAPVRRPPRRARAAAPSAGRWRRRGEGGLMVVTGEAGMGKSRLASRWSPSVAHAAGGAVLYGRADEETVVPYQPFVELLRHYFAHTDSSAAARGARPPARGAAPARARSSAATPRRRGETSRTRRFRAVRGGRRRCSRTRPPSARCCSCSTTCTGPTADAAAAASRRARGGGRAGARARHLPRRRDQPRRRPCALLADLSRDQVVARVGLDGPRSRGQAA